MTRPNPPPRFQTVTMGDGDWNARDQEDPAVARGTCGWLYAFIFLDLRARNDTLEESQRKIVVSWGLPLSILPMSFLLYMISEMLGKTGVTAGTVLSCIAMISFSLTWVTINVYVRLSRKLEAWLMDVWLLLTSLGCYVLVIALVEYPTSQIAFFLAALAFLCNTPRLPLHLVMTALLYLLGAINQAIAGLNPANKAMVIVPGAYWATISERLFYQGSGLFIAFVVAGALYMQTRERATIARTEAASSKLATAVAHELIKFDTEEAARMLRAYQFQELNTRTLELRPRPIPPRDGSPKQSPRSARGPAGAVPLAQTSSDSEFDNSGADEIKVIEVDSHLIAIFELLINHFDMFRSHLPNWLLSTAAHQGHQMIELHRHDDGESVDLDMESVEDPWALSGTHLPLPYLATDGEPGCNSNGNSPRGNTHHTPKSPKPSTVTPLSKPRESLKRTVNSGSHLTTTGRHVVPRVSTNSDEGYFRIRHSRVSIAQIDFVRLTPPNDAMSPFGTEADSLCAFVDAIHEGAEATYAAVHTFVGDSILVSWNTARLGASIECKAARFMAMVRSTVEKLNNTIQASGIVVTGDASVQMAGLSGKQHALTVSNPVWKRALRQLSMFSAHVGTLLLDEETYKGSHFTIEARVVDYVTVSKHPQPFTNSSTSASPAATPLQVTENSFVMKPGRQHGRGRARDRFASMPSFSFVEPSVTIPVYEVVRDLNADKFVANVASAAFRSGGHRRESITPEAAEWMYMLANSESNVTTAIKEAMDLAKQSKWIDARKRLMRAVYIPEASPPPGRMHDVIPTASDSFVEVADQVDVLVEEPVHEFNRADSPPRTPADDIASPPKARSGYPPLPIVGSSPDRTRRSPGGLSLNRHTSSQLLATPVQRRLIKKFERMQAENKTFASFAEDLTVATGSFQD